MISKAAEKRAQKLVLENIERALAEMREYVMREIAAGREPDKRMINSLVAGMDDLAREYSIDLVSGKYGQMIAGAMLEASAEVAEISGLALRIGRDTIDAALTTAGLKIKGILDDGQQVVAEELLKSIVGGRSQRELTESIAERLQVADEAGDRGAIPRWRAELVARNELSSNYRSTKMAAAIKSGFTDFKMVGPDDERTNDDVCSRYLGQVHTVDEWQEIADKEGVDPAYPLLEGWGFHPNCRHDWIGVGEPKEEGAEADAEA